MKIALVHEFLTQYGGAERVLEVFHEIFPDAPVYTLVYDKDKTQGVFDRWDIRTSFLQNLPGSLSNYKWYLPLMPKAIMSFDFSEFDLVISDSSAFAKGVNVPKKTNHISYIHTPTRYLWQSEDDYLSSIPYSFLTKHFVKPLIKYYLRPWDYEAAQKPDLIIANSKTVKERIKKYYDRESQVIYPPVDTDFFTLGDEKKEDYFFTASRLEPYKKIDLVVRAFQELGLPLKVAGDGTMYNDLKSQNYEKGNIDFLGKVTDEELRALYQNARAFVFPAFEDAGIMTLEALACGTPVLGLNRGGTAEFVRDGENGVLFAKQSYADIIEAVKRFEVLEFDQANLRNSVLQYSKQAFKRQIISIIHNS